MGPPDWGKFPLGGDFPHARKLGTPLSALFAAGPVRQSAAALGPVRARCEGGPTGLYSFVEGLEMAKKKLKKAKKLSAGKSLRIFLKTAG